MSQVYRKANCSHCGKFGYIAAKGMCRACYQRNRKYGAPIYVKVRGTCSIDGCAEPHRAQGFCEKHYARFLRHGHTDQTRSEDWGEKKKHPIYQRWMYLKRYKSHILCSEWADDFWTFYEDVGDAPSEHHKLMLINSDGQYEKSNVSWQEKSIYLASFKDRKEYARVYSKMHRAKNQEWHRNRALMKNYGMTLEQYNQIFDAQNGVCAICGKIEKLIHPKHNTNKPQPLSVDHCHKTGKVRGLLCSSCNTAIGSLNDDIELLEKAILYLKKH